MPKIIVPVVTVFDKNEKPDYEQNKKVIDYLLQYDLDGILVLGSTGEFTDLSASEKRGFFEFYADYVAGRTKLYAGTGSMNFQDTLSLSNAIYDMGYVAPLVIGPFYYGLDQEHIFTYYDSLAMKLKGNMYIYNYPARSGHSVAADTLTRLVSANPNIVGMKDTVSEPLHTNQVCQAMAGTGFEVYSGYDDQYLYNLTSGGCGSIGGFANFLPDLWVDLIHSTERGEFDRVLKLTHLLNTLMPLYSMGSSCSLLFKQLLVYRGVEIEPNAIFPFNESDSRVSASARGLLKKVLDEYKKMQ